MTAPCHVLLYHLRHCAERTVHLQNTGPLTTKLLEKYGIDGEPVPRVFRGAGKKAAAIGVGAQRLLLWVVWLAFNPQFTLWPQYSSLKAVPAIHNVVEALLQWMHACVPVDDTVPNLPCGQSEVQMCACLLFYVLFRAEWARASGPTRFSSLIYHAATEASRQGLPIFINWAGLSNSVRIEGVLKCWGVAV
jgi:hypothetical protein